jgi:hypothetical protein
VQAAQEHHPVAGHGLGSPGTSVRVSKALEMLTEVAALRADRGRAEYRPQMAAGQHTTAPPPPAQERARGAGERAHMRFRTITRNARALPDFLLIGGQRCGSTSLYTTLCGHPQVLAGAHKEPHYFDNNHLRGEHFYRRLFPLRAHLRARQAITGEATTHYLSHPAVPGRVAAMLPDVRLIAILRDPVERAYSHYQLAHRNGREPLSFEQALAAEPERLAGEEARLLSDPAYRGDAYAVQSYRTRGLYLEQLERWWAMFPPERLLVLRSEDMFQRPGEVYAQTVAFLGLRPDTARTAFAARNQVVYSSMLPETRAELAAFYAEPNSRLEQRLGRSMGWQGA